jgi:hypothetical protein
MLRAYAHGEVKPGPVPESDMQALLAEFGDVLGPLQDGLPPVREVQHLIPLIDPHAKPIAKPMYRFTPARSK